MTIKLKISKLAKDGLQTRVALDERTVTDYAEAMRDGAKFPPVEVFYDATNNKHWLADGFHRVEAALRAGEADIEAQIKEGSFIDALRFALGCNAKHGKRVTNEDKQNAMQMAWEHRQELFGGDPSGALLADTCGVHRNTAAAFVAEHRLTPSAPIRRQNTANGGKQVAQIVQPARPQRTVVGTDGKQYPVRPQRPVEHLVPTDRYGTEVPVPLQLAFDNAHKLNRVLGDISSARCALREGDPAFAAVRQDALVQLDNAYNFVAAAAPHCVCRMCQGQGCKACHGRGWQTEEEYDRNPREFKHTR